MADSLDSELPKNITSSSEPVEVQDPLYSILIANIIFNGCLCYTTIMLNIVTIYALRKTSSISKPLKTLLLSLAVSDLGVGLLGQPLEVAYLMGMLRWNNRNRAIDIVSAVVLGGFYLSSLCSIMAISADRFIAIQMPLRYDDLVTRRRVVTVVITIWLFSALLSPCSVLLLTSNATFAIFVIIESVFFPAATLFYYKIYFTIRSHKEQIQSQIQQLAENSDMADRARITKSAHSTFCIYLLFLLCYLPHLFISIARQIHGSNGTTIRTLYVSSETLVLLNSSLNPVIYCWKMRHIRHTIMDILRNISRS
ncbi:melanocyte-stimulating hormone receptor-like [Oculina patagonica]